MTYEQLKSEKYGIEVVTNVLEIELGLTLLRNIIKPEYQDPIEIHICGTKTYLIF